MTRIDRSPKLAGIVFSLVAGVTAVALVATHPAQLQALFFEVIGLSVLLIGITTHRRGRSVLGPVFGIAGGTAVLGAIGLGWISAGQPSAQLELLPGMVGLALLAAGVGGVRTRWKRGLIMAGAAGLFLGVLTSGVVHGAPALFLLGATIATVVAWDVGEQAVNLGEQVGTRAVSWPAELVHATGSVVVGVAGIALALGVYRFEFPTVSLTGLFLLLVGAVTLTAALYN